MAFGSGSSLATDCSMRRRGSPASLQLLRAGRASLLNQVSSKKPTTHSERPSPRRINRSRRLFSCVLRIWRSDPALGSLPAHTHPRQGSADGLARDVLFAQALQEAHLGSQPQRPQATVFAEVSGFLVQELAQGLGLFRIEGPVNSMRTFGALPKRLGNPPLVEGVDGVAHRLGVAAQGAGDLVGVLASGAGEQDLATAQSE